MPQLFNVLRCFKCLVFQVHQCKKSNKWECKMCGEKQSVKRNYGIGNAKECRGHVQRLNGISGEIDESNNSKTLDSDTDENETSNLQVHKENIYRRNESKWTDYVDKTEDIIANESETIYLNDKEVVLEIPKKKPRKKYNKKPYGNRKGYSHKHNNNSSDDDANFNTIHSVYKINETSSLEKEINEITLPIRNKVKFLPPVLQNKNNWNCYSEETKNDGQYSKSIQNDSKTEDNNVNIFIDDVNWPKAIPTIVSSIVKESSKWAQYIDSNSEKLDTNEDEIEIDNNFGNTQENNFENIDTTKIHSDNFTKSSSHKNMQAIFSICDDDQELDDILNL